MTKFSRDTPLRLAVAVKEAFPAGMTVSGLRREAAEGRLVIEVIAGKSSLRKTQSHFAIGKLSFSNR